MLKTTISSKLMPEVFCEPQMVISNLLLPYNESVRIRKSSVKPDYHMYHRANAVLWSLKTYGDHFPNDLDLSIHLFHLTVMLRDALRYVRGARIYISSIR